MVRAEETGSACCVELSRNNRSGPDLMIKRGAGALARAAPPPAPATAVTVAQPCFERERRLRFDGDFSTHLRG